MSGDETPGEQRDRNLGAIRLLDEWLAEDAQKEPDPELDRLIDRIASRQRSEAFHRLVNVRHWRDIKP